MGQQLLRVGAPCCKFSRALARTQTSARTQARAVPSSQESCLPLRRSLKPVLTTSLCGSSAEAFHSRRLLARQQRRSLSVTAAVSADAEPVSTSRVANKDGFANRQRIKDIKGGEDMGASFVGEEVTVRGWVRTIRNQKTFAFMEVNDGSTLVGLQGVIQSDASGYDLVSDGAISTGAAVCMKGKVVQSPGGKQAIEVAVDTLELIGACDSATYPLQKKRHSREFLRDIAHLRPRTNLIGAVARTRSNLAQATHSFFQERGFLYVNTPIITASDCEGAGEQFMVTTMVNGEGIQAPISHPEPASAPSAADINDLKEKVKMQGDAVRTLKEAKANKEDITEAVGVLLRLKEEIVAAETGGAQPTASPSLDFGDDFFAKPAYLTVSGQLNAEIYACALRDVYTFGPTFRAENSNTARHLAEFWMVEPELAFANLEDDMACAEAYLKHCVKHVLENCQEDMEFFDKFNEKGLIDRLTAVAEKDFATMTYTEVGSSF
ncbi:hypothetical protein CYMTET_31932 [Cymbomonas tetramitiformis]|uniref:asparagine--tRNA ligase n=1 Tax=Cymbomonas tetramitiformis TaxID=36881 RepID=A0AAE0KSE3_9CHLO|nr:hypothetical protein CYMTET_31932 [Cymbomonas tetramitiformis]